MKTKPSQILPRVAFACGAFLSVATIAAAQDMSNPPASSNTSTAPSTELAHIDKSFIEKAGKAGNDEVAISQVAVQRASNSQVKDFAQMMVSDHSSANATLAGIAANRGVTVPSSDDPAEKWTKKDAKDFDVDYIAKMVSDHEAAVKLFSKEADNGKDIQTQEFARKTLPTVQEHLEKAKDLQRLLKS